MRRFPSGTSWLDDTITDENSPLYYDTIPQLVTWGAESMDQLNMAISAVCEQAAFFRKGNGFQQQRPPTRLYQHISTTTGKIKSSPIRAPQVHKADAKRKFAGPGISCHSSKSWGIEWLGGCVMEDLASGHLCSDIIRTSWMPTEALSIHYGISLGDYPNDARIHAGWAG